MTIQNRYQSIDILRGSAVLLMIIYHFCYDLTYYRFVHLDFYNGLFWIYSRTFIVSLFLSVVGISLVISTRNGIRWPKYWKRLSLLIFFAGIISLASYFMFPGRVIFFGILHFIALASLLGLLFIRFYWATLVTGIGLLIISLNTTSPFFDQPWLQWIGMMTHKPSTEDYVPLLPWFSVVLIGMFLAQLMLKQPRIQRLASHSFSSSPVKFLEKAGQHSLLIYLAHQPILLAILYPFGTVSQ